MIYLMIRLFCFETKIHYSDYVFLFHAISVVAYGLILNTSVNNFNQNKLLKQILDFVTYQMLVGPV